MKSMIKKGFQAFSQSILSQAIHNGLIMSIPILTIGSLTVLLQNLPINGYQDFLLQFMGGAVGEILTFLYNATFGILSLYMTLTISLCYAQLSSQTYSFYGAPLVSLCSFIIIGGVFDGVPLDIALGVQGMFSAIFCAITASVIYTCIAKNGRMSFRAFFDGSSELVSQSFSLIGPAFITILIFAVAHRAMFELFHISSLQEGFHLAVNTIFGQIGPTLAGGLLYVLATSLFWMLGIHGSDMLEEMSRSLMTQPMALNLQNIAAGGQATEIMSKTFLDVFVMMGGCGAALSLMIAILLFARQHSTKRMARIACVPMLFNVNELMLFGLPVVFNPIFLVPFLLTPLIGTCIAFFSMSIGWVPIPLASVQWTTPILIGGYQATGSIAGSILQLINLVVGVFIYRPFVLLFERTKINNIQENTQRLADMVRQGEDDVVSVQLTTSQSDYGSVARMLVADLKHAIENKELRIYYQPQYDNKENCFGAEALLRWEHPICGMLYPPLVIQLAREGGLLRQLEYAIFRLVIRDIRAIESVTGRSAPKISVNLSSQTLQEDQFMEFLDELMQKNLVSQGTLAIEVTEQTALNLDPRMREKLFKIKGYGISMIIDDFSMGHTSLKYLQSDLFDMVKLDGSLIREMETNPRCTEILASIVRLSHSLNFTVLAEYVETEQQRMHLENIGCVQYQGYLYSPAVPLKKLMDRLAGESMRLPQHAAKKQGEA